MKLQQKPQQWSFALALRQNVGAEVLLSLLDLLLWLDEPPDSCVLDDLCDLSVWCDRLDR